MHEAMRDLSTSDPASILGRAADVHDHQSVPLGGFAAILDVSPFHGPGLANLREHDAASLVIGLAELETP
jgi:hypothetical protein